MYHEYQRKGKTIIPGVKICTHCKADLNKLPDLPPAINPPLNPEPVAVPQPGPAAVSQVAPAAAAATVDLHPPPPPPPPAHAGTPRVLTHRVQIVDSPCSSASVASSGSEYKGTPAELLESLNGLLSKMNVSAVDLSKLKHQRYYAIQKLQELTSALKSTFEYIAEKPLPLCDFNLQDTMQDAQSFNMVVDSLKAEFKKTNDRAKKIQLLSIVPNSWSIKKIQEEFDCPEYMVRTMRLLVQEEGILCKPHPKQGRPLDQKIEKMIIDSYLSEEISRPMPGKRDYKSVKEGGVRVQKQKRLLLLTNREHYALFCEKNPNVQVSPSKFASLRPPECIPVTSAGTHSVCVCAIHQNTELMARGAGLKKRDVNLGGDKETDLDEEDAITSVTIEDCLDLLMCDHKSDDCYVGECAKCPEPEVLAIFLSEYFERESISTVTYQQWVTVDRCTIETLVKPVDDFIDILVENLIAYKAHNFLAKKQAEALNNIKANLKVGEVVVLADFSENYSFIVQDAIQGYHWNNDQATVHPFVCYYRTAEDEPLKCATLMVISDEKSHNTLVVHTFQKELVKFLEEKIGKVDKVFYFSDGAASQYKNRKNVCNLAHHFEDFNVIAEWHFFATSHGKSPCDATARTLKREATNASLRRPYDKQITTPIQLYEYAKENMQTMHVVFVSKLKVTSNKDRFFKRMEEACKVPGIRSYHTLLPVSTKQIIAKKYSLSRKEIAVKLESKPV